jgi:hypothetical protein
MWTKLVAGTLFLTFLLFVNLAAAVATSSNRIETSAIASIAGIFQFLVDAGAVVVIGFVVIRTFVKLAQQAETTNRQYTAHQTRSNARASAQAQPFEPVNYPGWNAQSPLPFDNHAQTTYDNQTVLQAQPINTTEPAQGVLVQNIHRMRQQRSGYRMVR